MELIFERHSGNSYTIRDAVIQATVELLGGGDGMLVMLHSIKAVEPLKDGVDTSIESLINYLGHEITKQKRFGSFVIINKEKVVFSLDKELPSGTHIDARGLKTMT
jgi:hypothetical protein